MPSRIEHLLREHAPQVLGSIVRKYRDFADAEDAVQEALLAAASQWSADGVPDNPRAWLIQVASRRMTDQIRSDVARRRREAESLEMGYLLPGAAVDSDEDDTLRLIFLCCHPSLTTASSIALTLRAVGGLTTSEIASAFLVPEETMAQRISRAKQKIKDSGVSFEMQTDDRVIRSVLHVLYLIFNEGYTATSGDSLQRTDLANEAIRLTRLLHARLAHDPEVSGLLALMLLTDARRAARTGPSGEAIPLEQQDRSLWNRNLISEGVTLVTTALKHGSVGQYQLQAAIAAIHDEAPTSADTDWEQIVALYELLIRITGNPMARLNQAVAIAMSRGPAIGLAHLEHLWTSDSGLREHHRMFAVRGYLREMAGDHERALDDYREAARRTANLTERNYLLTRATRSSGTRPVKAK